MINTDFMIYTFLSCFILILFTYFMNRLFDVHLIFEGNEIPNHFAVGRWIVCLADLQWCIYLTMYQTMYRMQCLIDFWAFFFIFCLWKISIYQYIHWTEFQFYFRVVSHRQCVIHLWPFLLDLTYIWPFKSLIWPQLTLQDQMNMVIIFDFNFAVEW